jgi:urease accessory protein
MTTDAASAAAASPAPDAAARAGWHGTLQLNYQRERGRSVSRFAHNGPLRVLQSLYPEGDAVCHNVLVHPPGGLVGGDVLEIDVVVGAGAHGLVTTPGATRYYRTTQGQARQAVRVRLEDGSRLEWLPLETIAYNRCDGVNEARFDLAPGAELMAWDLTALGLPTADRPFEQGRLLQHFEVQNAWLERGLIDASDARLLDGPVGLAGHRCLGTLILASGSEWTAAQRDAALELAREVVAQASDHVIAGVTAAHPRVIVLRTLSALVEPSQTLLRAVWAAWRKGLWQMGDAPPRIWAM